MLYALVLNSENNKIDETLYNKIFLDFFLTDSKFLQKIESKAVDPSKGVILAKCVKFFRTYKQSSTNNQQMTQILNLENLLLSSYSLNEKSAQN